MGEIPLIYYLVLSSFLLCAGLFISITKKSAIFVLMGIELMLNAAHLNLAAFSRYDPNLEGQILTIFSIVLAACEVTIAISILLNIYRKYKTTGLDELTSLGR